MSLSKRNGVYYIDIRSPSGERIRRTTGVSDRKLAQEYHDKVKYEMWAIDRLDKPLERTFNEALSYYLMTVKVRKIMQPRNVTLNIGDLFLVIKVYLRSLAR